MTGARRRVLLFLKGMAIGAADSVPGVSGGTIAFITHIYDDLLAAILALTPANLRLLSSQGVASAWRALHGEFLVTLGSGVLLALLLSANLVVYLLESQYSYLMFFFNGLIIASLWCVVPQVAEWTGTRLLLLLAGTAFSVGIALLPSAEGSDNLLYYFLCGAVAICAMLLPGISGAFILLLFGAYESVLQALTTFNLQVIGVFAAGCLCGVLSVARLLSWLLGNRRQATLAVLIGILAGSLYSLWPWRQPLGETGGNTLVRQVNLPPALTDILTGQPLSPLLCALLALGACVLVVSLEMLTRKSGVKSNSSSL